MNILKLTLVFCILLGSSIAQAQETPDSSSTDKDTSRLAPIYYNMGVGLLNYRGDVGVIKDLGTTENLQVGFHAGVEYKITSSLGVSLNGGYATLTKNERTGNSNVNFQTKVINAGLSASFHFANGFILAEDYRIDPFISIGIDFLSFNSKTDSLDASGNKYFYWEDGSIRNIAQNPTDFGTKLSRDYKYETEIPTSGENDLPLAFPISIGFDFYINPYLKARVKQSVSITNTDFIDGLADGKTNDVLMYSSMSFVFNPSGLGKRSKKHKEYDDIDFAALLKADSDADGVLDIDDKCQFTDEGIKVDRHGCPLDDDHDGIPNHLDQDNKTKKSALEVDTNGVAIPDSLIAREATDTVVTLRDELCQFYPSMCQGEESDIEFQLLNAGKADKSLITSRVEPSKKSIEEIKKLCDINGNGRITSKEIYESIDNYFDGKIDLALGDIHKLIDYFFEQ
ncbi:hypothetical protein N8089_03650 [Flavobacteriales bacterium]|nr:hypothetical protein [Flavobacteriales bacterium]